MRIQYADYKRRHLTERERRALRAKYGDNLPEYKPPPGADDETMGLYGEAAGSSAAPAPLEDDGGASAWLKSMRDIIDDDTEDDEVKSPR